jgi:hypothetical protein
VGNSGGSGGTSSPLTTKGDVWGFSTVNARIPVGADTQALIADSTQALGVKWGAAGAAASQANEAQAAILINAASAGDAGGRADQFPGASLNPKWTVTGSASQTVGNSSLSIIRTSGSAAATVIVYETYTPSGAFRVEGRFAKVNSLLSGDATTWNSANAHLIVGDGASFTNYVGVGFVIDAAGQWSPHMENQAGVQGNKRSSVSGDGQWMYTRLDRNGSNQWNGFVSYDRALWLPVGTVNLAETFTVAALGWYVGGAGTGGGTACDFIDVVS